MINRKVKNTVSFILLMLLLPIIASLMYILGLTRPELSYTEIITTIFSWELVLIVFIALVALILHIS